MVTALVQIKLPQPLATAKAQAVFAETAPKYREVMVMCPFYNNQKSLKDSGSIDTGANQGFTLEL